MAALTQRTVLVTPAVTSPTHGVPGALRLRGLQWGIGAWQSAVVDLQVPRGQTLVLLGHNGAGKSALLDTLAGFLPARAGQVQLGAQDLTAQPPEKRRIGYMFQRDALFPHWTIARNLQFGRGAQADLDPLLDALDLRPWLNQYPHQLSGGQRQRVALARALVGAPELLLLDEPFSAIDPEARPSLRRTLAALLRERAITTVLVTHDPVDARLLGDLVGVLDGGRLLQAGTPQQVFERPADLPTARLAGVDNLWPLQVLAQSRLGAQDVLSLGIEAQPVLDWRGTLPAGVELQPGARVTLAVRAEAVHPCPASASALVTQDDDSLTLTARLIEARCEGPLWRLRCALPCGLEAETYALPTLWRELALEIGGTLGLRIRQANLHLLV
ncbi:MULTISPECIES: ABC transporter ATP-binding protein [unclassified Thiomonas]|jgi:ABC-type sulfate/molybdate transport systems ATPase subunit|uniref:ABC transporter ATP-binding protein n=1 Tax=unclassified Thiomonas TaxID=2625466 RepID=UPI0004DBAE10|nr:MULTISPECIES: ABC transporter ATP-binding protein [unclassified Thiomonas]MDD5002158.1 ABC transporter ATP-binding protein [Thiomonas arsenitoxydans]CDW92982.1 putative ABC-type Molybdate transport system, ATPase component [Thiomonas sp. CB2]VDY06496.1 putative ABC-type Molybdate transport system, ATPase component [Thiomonas sp. Bio17B3]VDY10208.1 putative ABC-type Molybdate transport system, ATPase component [Thiomonas sp. Sup16B3]VDY14769.1 putative ABC-type Molybdate transport system, AT